MRLPRNPADSAILATLLLPFFASGNNLECKRVVVEDKSFDLHTLGGPRSVMHSVDHGASFLNTTYTIDLCKPLVPAKGADKGADKNKLCPSSTRICGIERFIKGDDVDEISQAYPIAGDLRDYGGKDLDAKWSLLKKSSSHEDSQKEGLLLEVKGGFRDKKPQKAIIEFLCDRNRNGTEYLIDPEDKYVNEVRKREEGDGDKDKKEGGDDKEKKEGDADGEDKSPSLEFVRYDTTNADFDVLRLKWRTVTACEDNKKNQDEETKGSWGFFTWFILIAFLSTATYLIFGSWLNYNRYGARGWDLLPHGDTIRDVPYLLKDWIRRVMNSLQGGGSRGGYAAV